MKKTFYDWRKNEIRKIEVYTADDISKKPEIPSGNNFSKVHEQHLKKEKRTSWRKRLGF